MGPGKGDLDLLEAGGGWKEIQEPRILSLSTSNNWLNLGIIWVNKHLKCSEFNQMWIVLDGFFFTTTV